MEVYINFGMVLLLPFCIPIPGLPSAKPGLFDILGAGMTSRPVSFYNIIGCICWPASAASSASGIFVKSATMEVGFPKASSCPKGTK